MNNLSILQNYQNKKEKIINTLQQMIELGFVPSSSNGKDYTADKVKEIIKSLIDEQFTISICGQIKAGKSSLLNFLLFNDKVILPSDDTPWTAKLSTIRYGENEEAIVTFYNLLEWEELINLKLTDEESGSEINYYEEFLKTDVNNSALEGIYKENLIFSENKIKTGVSLTDLESYVTKPGLYTPFVKSVDISVKNDLCKGVVFVDTPGINDNNELRSKVTTDWISKSSAVIYLFYTGQPLSKADYDFIDTHLSSISTDKIIFVLTKADTSGDYQSAVRYVEDSLKNDPELRNRRLFSSGKKVYPISTYAALFKYKNKNGLKFTEDEEFHHDRLLEDNSDFYENDGYLPELISGIQSHLMSSKGQSILNKGRKIISDLGRTKIDSIKHQIISLKELEKNLSESSNEIELKRENIKDKQEEISNFSNKFNIGLKNFYRLIEEDFLKIIGETTARIRQKTLNSLEAIDRSYKKRKLVRWHFKDHFQSELLELNTNLFNLKIEKKTNELLRGCEEEVKNILKSLNGVTIQYFVSESIGVKEFLNNFSSESISDQVLKSKGAKVYWDKFNFKNEKFESILEEEVHELTTKVQERLENTIINDFNNQIERFFHNYLTEIRTKLIEVQKSYDEILLIKTDNEGKKREIIEKIILLQNEEEKFSKLTKELENHE